MAVHIIGLDQFRAELKKLDDPKRWNKELGKAQRDIAKKVAAWSSGAAAAMGGPQSHFAGAIRGRGGVSGARVAVARPEANAAFWGAKQRTGWNAGNEAANQPRWVGNSWDVGGAGGPYAINSTVRERMRAIEDMFGDAIDDVARRAFPT